MINNFQNQDFKIIRKLIRIYNMKINRLILLLIINQKVKINTIH